MEDIIRRYENTIERHENTIEWYKNIVDSLLENPLPERSKRYLPLIDNGGKGKIYIQLIDYLVRKTGDPPATARWNVNKLRESYFIITGTKNTKGKPTDITKYGEILLNHLNGNNKMTGK